MPWRESDPWDCIKVGTPVVLLRPGRSADHRGEVIWSSPNNFEVRWESGSFSCHPKVILERGWVVPAAEQLSLSEVSDAV